ncbi:MAG: hypothetical protein WB755_09670 [Terriglobales bacterium]
MAAESVLKCANPACESPSYCAGTGQFFRLEILAARETGGSIPRNPVPSAGKRPRLRVVDYWLCAHCAELYTLSYDHDAHMVFGVKRPQPVAEPELELAGNFLLSS